MGGKKVYQPSEEALDRAVMSHDLRDVALSIYILVGMAACSQQHHAVLLCDSACQSLCDTVSRIFTGTAQHGEQNVRSQERNETSQHRPERVVKLDMMQIGVSELVGHDKKYGVKILVFHICDVYDLCIELDKYLSGNPACEGIEGTVHLLDVYLRFLLPAKKPGIFTDLLIDLRIVFLRNTNTVGHLIGVRPVHLVQAHNDQYDNRACAEHQAQNYDSKLHDAVGIFGRQIRQT